MIHFYPSAIPMCFHLLNQPKEFLCYTHALLNERTRFVELLSLMSNHFKRVTQYCKQLKWHDCLVTVHKTLIL